MQGKQVVKWVALVSLVALMLAVATSGTGATPLAQEPEDAAPAAIICGDQTYCAGPNPSVYVQNNGSGAAIYGQNIAAGAGAGVYGRAQGGAGVRGQSNSGNGVFGTSYNVAGIRGKSTWGAGVLAESVNNRGVSATGPTGVYGESNAYSGEGVHGHGTAFLTEGVLGTSTQNVGVYGISDGTTGNNIGVWAQTAGTWGFYSGQSIQVNGCTGCTFSFIALNAEDRALEVGDVVTISGVAPPLQGQQLPLLQVRRASAASDALGIVQSRAEVATTQARTSSGDYAKTETVEIAGRTGGSVQPGDYLLVVVQGLVQVRADAGAGIQAGDRLVAGDGGLAILTAAEGQTIGRAVDAVDPATGLVWVLIDLQ